MPEITVVVGLVFMCTVVVVVIVIEMKYYEIRKDQQILHKRLTVDG